MKMIKVDKIIDFSTKDVVCEPVMLNIDSIAYISTYKQFEFKCDLYEVRFGSNDCIALSAADGIRVLQACGCNEKI